MNKQQLKKISDELLNTFLLAGERAIKLRELGLKKEIKSDNTPVTNGDIEVNNILTEKIKNITPAIPIVSEESVNNISKDGINNFWLIDPIDGTYDYINNRDEFTINAGLIIRGNALSDLTPSPLAAENLLERFLKIEKKFGRDRDISKIRWSARSLDIDLIAWSDLQIKNAKLILPHPRFIERDFVIIPLAAAMQKNSVGIKQIPEQEDWS